jgi:putative peptide zinc metalloprotease protein
MGSERTQQPARAAHEGADGARSTRSITPSSDGQSEQATSDGSPPRLAEAIELIGRYEGSGYKDPPYIARNADGGMIQLTQLLYLVASKIDGSRWVAEIARETTREFGRRVSADNVSFLLEKKLQPLGIIAAPDGSAPTIKKPDPLLALRFKTVLIPESAVSWLTILFKPLFWPPVVLLVLLAFLALDVWYFGVHGVAQGVRSDIYQPANIVLIYGLLVLSVAWHEVGHAAACRYGGAHPGLIGFGIYIVWPAFYTDVTDAYRLDRAGRVRTDLGGVYFNAIFALAITSIYLVTRFEALLIVVLMQHLLMLYQFMPFLRLDGYYVISDLTGVPDLFGRIGPTIRSLLPWNAGEESADALKPWVRVVVTLWILMVIPLLLYGFVMMVITAPRVIATTYDSVMAQWDKITTAVGRSDAGAATAGSLQTAMLLLPVGGMSVTFTRVVRRILSGTMKATRGKPVARSISVIGMLTIATASSWLLLPNGEYKPIQPGERGTIGDSVAAAAAITTGRPSLTPEREKELGGAPFTSANETGEERPARSGGESADRPEGEADPSASPSPTPTREEASPTPSPAESATPTPEPSVSPEE